MEKQPWEHRGETQVSLSLGQNEDRKGEYHLSRKAVHSVKTNLANQVSALWHLIDSYWNSQEWIGSSGVDPETEWCHKTPHSLCAEHLFLLCVLLIFSPTALNCSTFQLCTSVTNNIPVPMSLKEVCSPTTAQVFIQGCVLGTTTCGHNNLIMGGKRQNRSSFFFLS